MSYTVDLLPRRLLADLEHASDRALGLPPDLLIENDFGRLVKQRTVYLVERDHFHERAVVASAGSVFGRSRNESLPGILLSHLVQYARFRHDDERIGRIGRSGPQGRGRAADVVGREQHRLLALGMSEHLGFGILFFQFEKYKIDLFPKFLQLLFEYNFPYY